jgi:hypothetical protein
MMPSGASYETSLRRASAALVTGILAVATASAVYETIGFLDMGPARPVGLLDFATDAGSLFGARLVVWLFLWTTGMILFGVPAWLLLHLMKLRTPVVAAALGFGLCFGLPMLGGALSSRPDPPGSSSVARDNGGVTMTNGVLTQHGWEAMTQACLFWGFIGVAVALLIWRVAYRRQVPVHSS